VTLDTKVTKRRDIWNLSPLSADSIPTHRPSINNSSILTTNTFFTNFKYEYKTQPDYTKSMMRTEQVTGMTTWDISTKFWLEHVKGWHHL